MNTDGNIMTEYAKKEVDMSVNLAGMSMKTPVAVASGTFGFGREYSMRFDLNRLGAICVKGITLTPRQGNPPPRIAETPLGMLNSVGLQNPGVHAFITDELPFLRGFDTPVIANLSGNTIEEYAELAALLAGARVDMLEVNISCPNVKEGGLTFGVEPEMAAKVTAAVKREAGDVPVMVKLTPNTSQIAEIARRVEAAGADALSLINTLTGMWINTETRRPILYNNIGGLSGPAILPVAVRCVYECRRAVRLPILGMGGVRCASDAVQLMLAGAAAVAVGTALFLEPDAPLCVIEGLEAYCAAHGIDAVSELTDGVLPWGLPPRDAP